MLRTFFPRAALVLSAICPMFAFAAPYVCAAGTAKVLSGPRRVYDPATRMVGVVLEVSENADSFVVAAEGISGTFNTDYFCRKICPRHGDVCFQKCSVGLYYAGDGPSATAGSGLHRDNWTYAQACDEGGDCCDSVYEAHVMCDSGGGSGCPCWLFVRTDPAVSCDAGDPPAGDGSDLEGSVPDR